MTGHPYGTTGDRPLAVVTGASSGIGLEFARQCADHGFDLLVTAEDERITGAAEELRGGGGDVAPVRADLSVPGGAEGLWAAVGARRRPVDVAALNAGVGAGGPFLRNDLADELRIIDLNVRSTVHLAKRLLPPMVERGRGRVLVTSSVASTMPGPFQAVYNASKSFLQSFTEALQDELEDTGVTLTSLMPGATETEFFDRAGMRDTPIGRMDKDDAALVARQGFDALMSGRRKLVAGSPSTKAQGLASRVLPDRVTAAAHRRMARPDDGG